MKNSTSGFIVRKALAIVLAFLVVAAAASFGTYTWQHNKVNDLSNKVNNLNSQQANLNEQISALSGQLNKACPPAQQTSTSCAAYAYSSSKGVSIIVLTPTRNATVTSPVIVVGEVPGNWSFEAQFPVQLKDSRGNVIAQSSARLLGNWQTSQLVPFSVELTYKTTVAGNGMLVLQKDNPSGLAQNSDSVSIPVNF